MLTMFTIIVHMAIQPRADYSLVVWIPGISL